jgi:hypothetical protein
MYIVDMAIHMGGVREVFENITSELVIHKANKALNAIKLIRCYLTGTDQLGYEQLLFDPLLQF